VRDRAQAANAAQDAHPAAAAAATPVPPGGHPTPEQHTATRLHVWAQRVLAHPPAPQLPPALQRCICPAGLDRVLARVRRREHARAGAAASTAATTGQCDMPAATDGIWPQPAVTHAAHQSESDASDGGTACGLCSVLDMAAVSISRSAVVWVETPRRKGQALTRPCAGGEVTAGNSLDTQEQHSA